jgi:GAF domain-containing protein
MEATLAHFLEIHNHQGCRQIPLEGATYSIGRTASNSIVINSPEISRQHAILLRMAVPDSDHHFFRIVDGNLKGQQSTNGLFVNGIKRSSHILRHGDEIEFGGRTKAIYCCTVTPKGTAHADALSGEDGIDPFSTVMVEQALSATSVDAEMARLVSFLELSPHPIIELDLSGKITYVNPAATAKFRNLKELGSQHPILVGLTDWVQTDDETALVREVETDDQIYQQAIYYLPESQLIRLNMLDITHKKRTEAELCQRDTLLQAIAQATRTLLVELDVETAIQEAITIFGEAIQVEYIFVCQQFPHVKATLSLQVQFVWSAVARLPLTEAEVHRYCQLSEAMTGSWYAPLSQGKAVKVDCLTDTCEAQPVNQPDSLPAILLVPVFVQEQYWGFIGVTDHQAERQWLPQEESSLFTLAASISATLNRQRAEEKMRHRALYDVLTELPNRTLFDEQLSFCLKQTLRDPHTLAVMFLDLDRFKVINDTLGHTLGDQLLKAAAIRISHVLREGDLISRWGGMNLQFYCPKSTTSMKRLKWQSEFCKP